MWDEIKGIIGKAAPLVGSLIGGPAGGTIGTLISTALGVEDSPEAIYQELMTNPEALLKVIELQATHSVKLQELALKQAEVEAAERITAMQEQGKTTRTEIKSDDRYVRRWRPTFGYAVCISWVTSFAAIAYGIVNTPQHAVEIVNAFVALTPLFTVALSILGVNIYQRSQDKKTHAGIIPNPLLSITKHMTGTK